MSRRFGLLAQVLALALLLGLGLGLGAGPSAFAATGTATVSGHVFAPDGVTPATDGAVGVYTLQSGTWSPYPYYETSGVASDGSWSLTVQVTDVPQDFRIELVGSGGYDDQYYSDGAAPVFDVNAATSVPLAIGDAVAGKDFTVAQNPDFGTMSGTVTDPQGQPVSTAVKIHPDNGATPTVVLSDAATGSWSTRVHSGGYTVSAGDSLSDGWATSWYGGTVHADVQVTPGGTSSGLEIHLTTDTGSATIGGHLTDPNNAPVDDGTVVTVVDVTNSDRSFKVLTAGGAWQAQVQGGDTYKLGFSEDTTDHYVAEYWNNQTTLSAGQTIAPAAGSDVKTYDAQLAFEPMVNTVLPSISGTVVVGQTLTASPGTWVPAGASFTYQWASNGAAIAGATGSTFVVTQGQVGRRITVTVTASKTGYAPASATSAATVNVKAKPTVAARARVGATGRTTLVVQVDAGVRVLGKVRLHDGTRLLGTVRLHDGRASTTVRLGRGVHHLRACYLGSRTVRSGTTRMTVRR